jgi:hypothetical protein
MAAILRPTDGQVRTRRYPSIFLAAVDIIEIVSVRIEPTYACA